MAESIIAGVAVVLAALWMKYVWPHSINGQRYIEDRNRRRLCESEARRHQAEAYAHFVKKD